MRQGKWLVLGSILTVFLWGSPLAQGPAVQAAEEEKAIVTPLSDEEVSAVRDFLTNFKGIKFNGFVESFYQYNSVDPRGADGLHGQQGAVGGRRGGVSAGNEAPWPGGAKNISPFNAATAGVQILTSPTVRNIGNAQTVRGISNVGAFPASTAFGGVTRPRFLEIRGFDREDNSFTLNNIELHLYKDPTEPGDIGFRITTLYGEIAQRMTFVPSEGRVDDDDFSVAEGFVWWKIPVGKGIDLKFGKFATYIGAEVWEAHWNPNWSRSLLYNNAIPFTHTGFSVGYPLLDSLYATAFFINGWDTFVDNNKGKTIGYQFRYTLPDMPIIHKAFLVLNASHGPEQPDNNENLRHFWDLIFQFSPIEKLTLNTNIDFGTEEFESGMAGGFGAPGFIPRYPSNAGASGILVSPAADATRGTHLRRYLMNTDEQKNRKWWGIAQIANYQFTDRIGFALRGEYFWDQDAARIIPVAVLRKHRTAAGDATTGADILDPTTGVIVDNRGLPTIQSFATGGLSIGELTGTLNLKIRDKLHIRPEVRYDKIISAHGGTSQKQFDGHTKNITSGVSFTYEF